MSFESQGPQQGSEAYSLPGVQPEALPDNRAEVVGDRPTQVEAESTAAASIPLVPAPIVVADDAAAQVVVTDDTNAPLMAADDDLIEREWVDKAKKIIEETKDDPFKREQEVGRLQREYIKKRYGREIGEPIE